MASGATNAAADVENGGVGCDMSGGKEELDEVDLSLLLGLIGFGVIGGPVAVVDVSAPGRKKVGQLVWYSMASNVRVRAEWNNAQTKQRDT